MRFSDKQLARRLERAEGYACLQHAEARRRIFPDSDAEWMECAGAYAVFDGVQSPITQSFGLGLWEEASPSSMDAIEQFFFRHRAPVFHEICPFAGISTLNLLCERSYRPVEISSVLFMPAELPAAGFDKAIRVRVAGPEQTELTQLWAETSTKGWKQEHPELEGFLREIGAISSARKGTVCFLAEIDGTPGAAGALCLHEGVALFGGSATIPELRRRGLQTALLNARMRYACEQGCDIAMMAAEPGSDSQRNAERQGFRIAYTRIKWRLH